MNDRELKNLIARCAVSGVANCLDAFVRAGFTLTDCDVAEDGSAGGLPRSAQIVLEDQNGWPRVFEFTVRELQP